MNTIALMLCLLGGQPALAAVETEDCYIQIAEADVDAVPLINPITKKKLLSENKHLAIVLIVTNLSETQKLDYEGAAFNRFMSHAKMKDDLGNDYKAVTFGINEVALQQRTASVYPGKYVMDIYVFEIPVDAAKTLTMTISGESVGSKKEIKLAFPSPKEKTKLEKKSETPNAAFIPPPTKEGKSYQAPRSKTTPDKRRWTDADGAFTLEAEFVSMAAGKVKLKKADGSLVTLPMDKLSEDDQRWIRKRAR